MASGGRSQKRSRLLKPAFFIALLLLVLGAVALWWCDHHIKAETAELVYDQVGSIPFNRVGVVLGTSEKGHGGGPNLYFTHRMKAAAELYHAGKVEHLLLSGDNGRKGYNEPADMRRALIQAGVDSTDITLDYAGFRTFDSMVRAREVFGQDRFTVISQRFHNERAIYIAAQAGLQAIGFNAKDVTGRSGWRTALREKAARVKVFVDMALGIDPKFLGDPVELGTQPPPDPER
jgi:SanA protein